MVQRQQMRSRIAIVGAGISGNVCAWLLHKDHDITVFSADDHVGGHTHTHSVSLEGREVSIDTGFMVFNEKTYPNFIRLLQQLGVRSQLSDMSFSVRCDASGLEYQGSSLNGLFAQRSNFFRPSFYRMLRDISRFNREAPQLLETPDDSCTLERYVRENHYSDIFLQHYLVPLGASIWSCPAERFLEFPARFLVAFLQNHGLLQIRNRPRWYTICGGAQSYVQALTQSFSQAITTQCPIRHVDRKEDGVLIKRDDGSTEPFDQVIFATHADTTLNLLSTPTDDEKEILSHFAYQQNEAILHTDRSWMPQRRRAWASWNYLLSDSATRPVSVTYDVNRLQKLGCSQPVCVTLNPSRPIDDRFVLERMTYQHPVFSAGSIAMQKRHKEINGKHHSYFCGAYWGYGFHEDGVNSGLAVAKCFGKYL